MSRTRGAELVRDYLCKVRGKPQQGNGMCRFVRVVDNLEVRSFTNSPFLTKLNGHPDHRSPVAGLHIV